MLRTMIIDDELLARNRLRKVLSTIPDVNIVGEAENGADAVAKIEQLCPDLLLLDVQMPDLDGFAVLKMIEVKRMPYVIFVTAFEQYAVDAFEKNAVDYLLKPVVRKRLEIAIRKAQERHKETGGRFRTAGNVI